MTITLIFLGAVAAIVGWWLSHQRLTSKPWLEEGVVAHFPQTEAMDTPAAKLGLRVFFVIASALFALLISAYVMRRDAGADWRALPTPPALWVNTGLLVLASFALHGAQTAVRREDIQSLKSALLMAIAATLAFLIGQALVWRQLADAGYALAGNPANTFFYLLTALHGLHVAGGMVALGATSLKTWRGLDAAQLRLSVELCAAYWHFLLLLWLILFALLMRWVDGFVDICRQLLS